MTSRLLLGCSREHLAAMDPCSVDAIVTDPPYEIGFMGRSWDSTGIAYDPEFWRLCLNVLKPGGHLVSFGACRTYHRIACAIEDAGFEIRDSLHWLFGSGMPKSWNFETQFAGEWCSCEDSGAMVTHGKPKTEQPLQGVRQDDLQAPEPDTGG